MFKEKLTAGLSKISPVVKLGAKQAAKGKPGLLAATFAKKVVGTPRRRQKNLAETVGTRRTPLPLALSKQYHSWMTILNNEAAIAVLTHAAQQLQALGIHCLLSPMSLPQGMTISLHVGDSVEASIAADVAATCGAEKAHSAAGADEFRKDVALKMTEATILKAAYLPPHQ